MKAVKHLVFGGRKQEASCALVWKTRWSVLVNIFCYKNISAIECYYILHKLLSLPFTLRVERNKPEFSANKPQPLFITFSSNLILRNMALATVAGAFLSSFLNVVFDRLSSPDVVKWIQGKKVDQNLLQRLKTSLYVFQAVLNDAEQKQITDPAVKNWLADLEDAVYVADDLLDEVSTKAATQKGSGNFLSQSLNLEERELVTKIEGIIDRLGSIVKFKDTLRLEDFAEDNMSSWRVPSTSLVEKSYIYGRDKDKETIVELLLDDACDGEIPVISIVGMGGIGKTTLA